MGRQFFGVLAVALSLGAVDPALAILPKPPKSICMQFTDGAAQFQMILGTRTASGAVQTQNMTYRAYSISGEIAATAGTFLGTPISGAGYMNGTFFRFSFTGATPLFSAIPMSGTAFWDVSSNSGSIFVNNGGLNFDGILSQIPCTAISVP